MNGRVRANGEGRDSQEEEEKEDLLWVSKVESIKLAPSENKLYSPWEFVLNQIMEKHVFYFLHSKASWSFYSFDLKNNN